MSAPLSAQLCRLVVCGPDRQVELAVPANVPIADLLPTLLGLLGPQLADTGLDHEGWVLQRLGERSLDEDASAAALGLRDGETLYLRPRGEQIPPADFDDLIDGVATGMRQRATAWRPEMTRWAAYGWLALVLGCGLGAVALPGPTRVRAATAAVMALLALVTATAAGRTARQAPAATVLALAAIGYATLAGLLAPGPDTATTGLPHAAINVSTAGSAAAGMMLLAALLVGQGGPWFAALAASGLVGLVGGVTSGAWKLPPGAAAGLAAVVAGIGVLAVPGTAFRLSGLRLAPLPSVPEHLQEDVDPEPSTHVLSRTRVADHYMTGLYLGLAVAGTAGTVLLTVASGWAPRTLAALLAAAGLLAARPMTSGWHRLAAGLPAIAALPALTVTVLGGMTTQTRVAIVAVAVPAVAGALFWAARVLPVRRPTPYWGRFGDVCQTMTTVAQIPVLLAVFDAYRAVRGWGG